MALVQCLFVGNYGGVKGGAISICSDGTPTMHGCTFVANEATTGSGIYTEGQLLIDRTIIAFNEGGAGLETLVPATIYCSDIYGNSGGDWIGEIEHLLGVNGNLNEDPLFCNVSGGNYALKPGSPCSPENNPDCGLIGTGPVGCSPAGLAEDSASPYGLRLLSCAPNPFRDAARIDYRLDRSAGEAPVRLQILDPTGRVVRTLVEAIPVSGQGRFAWDGRTERGQRATQGAYLYRLSVGHESRVGRLLLIR